MHANHFRDSAMNASPAWELERYLPLLRCYSRKVHLDPRLRRRFGESDLVSESLLRAHERLGQCEARTEGQFVAWLQQVFKNATLDLIAREFADKRHPGWERVVEKVVDE